MKKLIATKRQLVQAGLAGAGLLAAPALLTRPALAEGVGERLKEVVTGTKEKEEVTPPEDLMREHGVLDRVLLLYEATTFASFTMLRIAPFPWPR